MKKNIHISLFNSLFVVWFLVLGVFLGVPVHHSSAAGASLSVTPSQMTIAPSQTFTAEITLDANGESIDGVDIYSLHFNPSILQIVDSDSSQSGVQIAAGSLLPLTLINSVDNAAGTVQFSQVNLGGNTFTGSGTLATITFSSVANGTSAVTIDFSGSNGNDSNVAGGGVEKLTNVDNASYKVVTTSTSGGGSSGGSSSSGGGKSRGSTGGSSSSSSSNTNTNASTSVTTTIGCTSTSLFSSVTGQKCAGPDLTPTVGCIPGALFSTVTGGRCATTPSGSPIIPTTTYIPPVSSSSPVITKTLFITMRDPQVSTLQTLLIKLGYNIGGSPTGYFGTLTDAAVKNFQRTHGIAYSGTLSTTGYGLVGPKTKSALLNAVASQ